MRLAIVSLLLLGSAVALSAQTAAPAAKPNYSGTWVFDAHKSKLVVPPPSSMTLEIKQEDPRISFMRTQAYGDQSFNWKLAATVDDPKPVQEDGPGYVTDSRVYWQQNALVLEQKITSSDGTKVSDVVTYTLQPDGTLQAYESQTTVGGKGANNNRWIYDKKP